MKTFKILLPFKSISLTLLLLVLITFMNTSMSYASERLFEIQSIDTMKYSRDNARNPQTTKEIPKLVSRLAGLGATHIAISTPYDEEFYPVLKVWVTEIRKHKMNVWFRGNFSSWEGWFDYPKFTDPFDHISKTSTFITSHPDLFQEGDIFTPVPEPENGGVGDPRTGENVRIRFFQFLRQSYAGCVQAFSTIQIPTQCGYYSVNGDVARLFTHDDVVQTGGVLVIDHYVRTPQQLIQDAELLQSVVQAPIVLGEFGLPIPDIHGDLTEQQQADLIKANMEEIAKRTDVIKGVNYWTAYGGSTAIFDGNNTTPRKAVKTLSSFYNPYTLYGRVLDEYQNPIEGATIDQLNGVKTLTDKDGSYTLALLPDTRLLEIKKEGYAPQRVRVYQKAASKHVRFDISIAKSNKSIIDYIKQIIKLLFSKQQ